MAPTPPTFFKFKSIKLPKNARKTPYVPTVENFVREALKPKDIEAVMGSILDNEAVLLVGPTGCGKTTTVKWLAEQTNNSYRRVQLTGGTGVDNLVGKWLINSQGTYWEDGILTEAMRQGYWILLDELNAVLPEVLFVINSVLDGDRELILDEKHRERVKAHPDFRLFAAMNPWEDYAGTKELNRAQLDRFQGVVEFEYADPKFERDIVSLQSGIDLDIGKINQEDKGLIDRMVEFANVLRKMNEKQEIVYVCSTRQLIQWGNLAKYLSIKDAANIAILNKADKDERSKIKDELNKFFRNEESLTKYVKELEKKKKTEVKNIAESIANSLNVPETTVSGTGMDLPDTEAVADEAYEEEVVIEDIEEEEVDTE